MPERDHFRTDIDTTMTPQERGRLAAGRGGALEDCPFDAPDLVRQWQQGWRARNASLRRLAAPDSHTMALDDAKNPIARLVKR